jgi:hypothetical protein
MSRRNMSERAMGGLMLCDAIGFTDSFKQFLSPTKQFLSPTTEVRSTTTEDRNLNILNNNIPNGVDDKNKFRPLAMLLQSIGESNANGGTPYGLPEYGTKLFLDFMKEAVPVTGNPVADKTQTQTVLNRIQQTFGLTNEQVKDLQGKIDENRSSNKASENLLKILDEGLNLGATNTSNTDKWMKNCPHCQKAA